MRAIFSKDVVSDSLDFQNGEYRRLFERKDQPFEVTDEEWKILKRTPYFEQAEVAAPTQDESDESPPTDETLTNEQQSSDAQSDAPKRPRKSAQNKQ